MYIRRKLSRNQAHLKDSALHRDEVVYVSEADGRRLCRSKERCLISTKRIHFTLRSLLRPKPLVLKADIGEVSTLPPQGKVVAEPEHKRDRTTSEKLDNKIDI